MREHPDAHHDRDEVEDVSPELVSLHRRLFDDGKVWRRQLPAGDELIRRTRAMTGPAASADLQEASIGPGKRWRDTTGIGEIETGSYPAGAGPLKGQVTPMAGRTAGRMRVLATGAVAVAVVALLALLLHSFAAGREGPGTGPGTASTPDTQGRWQTLSGLTFTTTQNDLSALPAVAPSDPNTVYQTTLNPVKLRRTTDAGAHWTDLRVPGDTSNVQDFQVFVSPLDATRVFLTLTSPLPPQSSPSACPTLQGLQAPSQGTSEGLAAHRGTAPLSGRIPCSLQYFSADGGATWQQLTLPVRAVLVDPQPMLSAPALHLLRSQGSRLFAAAGCGMYCVGPGLDIVTSVDGGAHWTLADKGIRANSGGNVCDFGVSPSGGDLFALVSPQYCGNESLPPVDLWHSSDAGAHWSLVGPLPSDAWLGLSVVPQPQGEPLLYIHLPNVTVQGHGTSMSDGPTSLKVSADGGKTWTAAPAGGITTTSRLYSGPLAVLPDGTVIENYGDPTTANGLYGWKLGDAQWHQVAPPLHGQVTQVLVEAQGTGYSLLAVTIASYQQSGQSISGETITVQSYTP